jgi:hypothetical protein
MNGKLVAFPCGLFFIGLERFFKDNTRFGVDVCENINLILINGRAK